MNMERNEISEKDNMRGYTESTEDGTKDIPASSCIYRFIASDPSGKPAGPELQSAVRRHVMKTLPKSRKPHDPNRIDIYLPPSFSNPDYFHPRPPSTIVPSEPAQQMQHSPTADSTSYLAEEEPKSTRTIVPATPISVLGQGRIDPFTRYPIHMSKGEYWLLDQVNSSKDLCFKNLRERWLPLAINDAGAFHQYLSNASLNLAIRKGEETNDLVALAHHSLAIRTVNSELADPSRSTSDDIIASILQFICYCICRDDFTSVKIHVKGLNKIIALRGGVSALRNLMLVRLVYEVHISSVSRRDVKPRVPIPEGLLHACKAESPEELGFQAHAFRTAAAPWRRLLLSENPLLHIFDEINSAIAHSRFKSMRNEKWKHADFVVYWIEPIMHKLLNIGSGSEEENPLTFRDAALRMGMCLFLGPIRRNCGKLGVSTRIYVIKLKSLLAESNNSRDRHGDMPKVLLLWILFFGLLESWKLPEEEWFIKATLETARGCGLRTWSGIVETVQSFLWMEDMFAIELERTRNRAKFDL